MRLAIDVGSDALECAKQRGLKLSTGCADTVSSALHLLAKRLCLPTALRRWFRKPRSASYNAHITMSTACSSSR